MRKEKSKVILELVLAATGLLLIVNLICQYRADSIKEQADALHNEALDKRIDSTGERIIMFVTMAEMELTCLSQVAIELSSIDKTNIIAPGVVKNFFSQMPKREKTVREFNEKCNLSVTKSMGLRSQATVLEQKSNIWSLVARWVLYVALLMNAITITLSFGIYRLYKT